MSLANAYNAPLSSGGTNISADRDSRLQAILGQGSRLPRHEPPCHPLWMHSLDVAAVGREFAPFRPRLVARLSERLGWSADEFRDIWVFLLALHDSGKFSEHFQAKAEAFWPATALGPREALRLYVSDPGHPAAADVLLFPQRKRRAGLFEARIEAWFPDWGGEADTVRALFAPILGHHGRPVTGDKHLIQDLFGEPAEAAALAFADAMHALLRPPNVPEPKTPALRRATWPLAGPDHHRRLGRLERDWFPYRENGPTPKSTGTRSPVRMPARTCGGRPRPFADLAA